MPIKASTWKKRIGERSDLSSSVTHLTRGTADGSLTAVDVLLKILREKKIRASTPSSGFIIGNASATCFQDTPLYYLAQNVHAEQVFREANKKAKKRYVAVGLLFHKFYVYRRGGRPVLHEKKATAKRILQSTEYWRIVNYDLSIEDEFIDWTHEREWRVKGDFEFSLDKATVILASQKTYSDFIKKCALDANKGILDGIKGLVTLSDVYY